MSTSFLDLESGDYLLLEDGGHLALEDYIFTDAYRFDYTETAGFIDYTEVDP